MRRATAALGLLAASAAIALGVAMPRHGGAQAAASAATGATLDAAQRQQAEHRAALCSSANASGSGLRGEYFAGTDAGGAALLARLDATLEPDPARDAALRSARSARWSGWIKAPLSGRYRFHAGPASRVELSRLDVPADGVELVAGRFYPIRVTASDFSQGTVRLEWTAPHGARYVVPRALLFPPGPVAAPRS